jgi:RNA polymerase sigma factor (sigma-70 family)
VAMHATSELSDTELINRILNGEKELYAQGMRRYNQRLYKIGISILNDDAEVEDAMQVAYINAYEHLGKFSFKSSFATWLTRILINECLLRQKRKGKFMTINADQMDNDHAAWQPRETRTPATQVLNTELKTILENAIRQLPEIYRTVFVMREIEHMNIAETRECLDISEDNVKVRLNRAKAMLRNLLYQSYQPEDLLQFHLSRCDKMVERVMSAINA